MILIIKVRKSMNICVQFIIIRICICFFKKIQLYKYASKWHSIDPNLYSYLKFEGHKVYIMVNML